MATIKKYQFNKKVSEQLKKEKYGVDWPTVYIITNNGEAYIGETVNASARMSQHLTNEDRKKLKEVILISDDKFNKSVILDLEAYLIKYMAAEGSYILQNSNMGNRLHNYYNREEYEKSFADIWDNLRENKIVKKTIAEIENSDIYKYSPYKTLNYDQQEVFENLIKDLVSARQADRRSTAIVSGGAGTGKTVLAVYLVKLLSEIGKVDIKEITDGIDLNPLAAVNNISALKNMKIGFVVPMQSLRKTMSNVFKVSHFTDKNIVIKPIDVSKEHYDLLIVDEGHRLRQRKALNQYSIFDKINEELGLDEKGTELDWILKCSEHQIIFYDPLQSVKPSDINSEKFIELSKEKNTKSYFLQSQLRSLGGNDYIEYVRRIFSSDPPEELCQFKDYEFRLFENAEQMIQRIRKLDKKYGLCRNAAGYAWKWRSKKEKDKFDISLDGKQYKWNSTDTDWINSQHAIDEIGCIHTVQGYDLNYVGVILGNEIKYDKINKKIIIDKKQYFDNIGKTAVKNDDELKQYIINIYITLMTRGIRGTYVYVCDDDLREYMEKYISY